MPRDVDSSDDRRGSMDWLAKRNNPIHWAAKRGCAPALHATIRIISKLTFGGWSSGSIVTIVLK